MARLIRLALVFGALLGVCTAAMAEPISSILGAIGSAVGAGMGSAVAVGGMIVSTALSFVSSAYGNMQAKKQAKAAAARRLAEDVANIKERMTTIIASDAPHTVIYGEPAPVGGAVVAVLTGGEYNHLKHVVLVLAAHPCEAVTDIQIEGVSIGALDANGYSSNPEFIVTDSESIGGGVPGVNVQIHLSPDGVDTADAYMRANLDPWPSSKGMWTEAHKLSGFTYIVVTLNLFVERFQGGLPAITANVKGKKVYDPRTGATVYTRNPALCLADFLRSEEGYLASNDQIDQNALIVAANACDTPIYNLGGAIADRPNYGGSAARYTCDGMFRSDQDRDSTRQQLEDTMAGYSLESGGVWRILAGAWTTPVLAMSDDDLLAPMTVVQTCNPGTARYNGAKGTYVNLTRNGVSEDFKQYQNTVFRENDQKDKFLDLVLPFTTAHVRTHQIARVLVEQSRGGFVLQIHPKMLAWHLQPGDRIVLTSALYGFANKPFRVQDWTYSMSSPLSFQVIEDEESFYDTADEVRARSVAQHQPAEPLPAAATAARPAGAQRPGTDGAAGQHAGDPRTRELVGVGGRRGAARRQRAGAMAHHHAGRRLAERHAAGHGHGDLPARPRGARRIPGARAVHDGFCLERLDDGDAHAAGREREAGRRRGTEPCRGVDRRDGALVGPDGHRPARMGRDAHLHRADVRDGRRSDGPERP